MSIITKSSSGRSVAEARLPMYKGTGAPIVHRLIDLFCGAGGMTAGFRKNGFVSVWANDFNEAAAKTYRANFGGHCASGDIVGILEDPAVTIPAADVVIGGPPCQGFSLLNKGKEGDPRRHLWMPYLDVVERSGAEVFVMENVPQLLGSPEHAAIVDRAESMGFCLASARLIAADYGVSQTRTRAFIVGCRFADPKRHFPPVRTHYNPKTGVTNLFEYSLDAQPWLTVRAAISDLCPPVGTEPRPVPPPYNLHFGQSPTPKSIARYRAIPGEGMNREDLLRNAPQLTPRCWLDKKGGTDLFGRLPSPSRDPDSF